MMRGIANVALVASTVASLGVGSASAIEIIWTLTGVAGIYFTLDNLKDARLSITAIRKMNGHNLSSAPELSIIAFGHYRNEVIRMMMCGVIVAVGIAAMITPPIANAPKHTTPVSLAITIGLFMLTALIVSSSFLDRRQRDLLMRDPVSP